MPVEIELSLKKTYLIGKNRLKMNKKKKILEMLKGLISMVMDIPI